MQIAKELIEAQAVVEVVEVEPKSGGEGLKEIIESVEEGRSEAVQEEDDRGIEGGDLEQEKEQELDQVQVRVSERHSSTFEDGYDYDTERAKYTDINDKIPARILRESEINNQPIRGSEMNMIRGSEMSIDAVRRSTRPTSITKASIDIGVFQTSSSKSLKGRSPPSLTNIFEASTDTSSIKKEQTQQLTAIDIVLATQLYPGDMDILGLITLGLDQSTAWEVVRLHRISRGMSLDDDNIDDSVYSANGGDGKENMDIEATGATGNPMHVDIDDNNNDTWSNRPSPRTGSVIEMTTTTPFKRNNHAIYSNNSDHTRYNGNHTFSTSNSSSTSSTFNNNNINMTFNDSRNSVLVKAQDVYNLDKSPKLTVIMHYNYKRKFARYFKYTSLIALDLWWCVLSKRFVSSTRRLIPAHAKYKSEQRRPIKRVEYQISPWKNTHVNEYALEIAERQARIDSRKSEQEKSTITTVMNWFNFYDKFTPSSYILAPTQHATIEEEKAYLLSKVGQLPSYFQICEMEMLELRSIATEYGKKYVNDYLHFYFQYKIQTEEDVPIYIILFFIICGFGHVCTPIGRRICYIVVWNYYRFAMLCCGIWDDTALRCVCSLSLYVCVYVSIYILFLYVLILISTL